MADIFDPQNQVKSAFMKWNKVGDYVKGTLLSVREVASQLPATMGEMQKIYEIRATAGVLHQLDDSKHLIDEDIVIKDGEIISLGGKVGIDAQMRNVKLGQIIGIRFEEEKPSKTKGFNPTKVIRVYAGAIDPTYMGESASDMPPFMG